jgi:arsenite transporter
MAVMEKRDNNDDEAPSSLARGDVQLEPTRDPFINKDHSEDSHDTTESSKKSSVYAGLGWLDRLLVLWILLAIIIGIVLGNFVDGIGPALQQGKFVDVSVPIGESKLS